jgi:hypothetical protein
VCYSNGRLPGYSYVSDTRRACLCHLEEELVHSAPSNNIISSNVPPEYDNSSVGEEEHFEKRHFYAVLRDWQVGWYIS